MGHSKKKRQSPKPSSCTPEQMIKTRMRNIDFGKCYISKHFSETGEGSIIVTHEHTGGNISLAVYLIDTYCLGLKDSFYSLRISPEDFKEQYQDDYLCDFNEISYNEAHNYIYGAIAFAKEAGISPDPSFRLTQFFLKEDDESVPLIEYDFGKNGQHFLIAQNALEASKYLPKLRKNLGENFDYIVLENSYNEQEKDLIPEEDDFYKDLEDITPERINEMLEKSNLFKRFGDMTPYTYQHPAYPETLDLHHPILKELLFSNHRPYLEAKDIEQILKFPHDTLRQDLEVIILYSLAQTYKKEYEQLNAEGIDNAILHAIFLLGDIGTESNLNVMLEVLRQPEDVSDKLFGDLREDILIPTLYHLGKDRLDLLFDFAQEPGLYTYLHTLIYPTMSLIATKNHSRRKEVLEWYRKILQCATAQLPDCTIFDSTTAAFIICELIDIHGQELLPEIKTLFETGAVDLGICGTYENVAEDIQDVQNPVMTYSNPLDISGRYKLLKEILQ